jgi:hypothetical protein
MHRGGGRCTQPSDIDFIVENRPNEVGLNRRGNLRWSHHGRSAQFAGLVATLYASVNCIAEGIADNETCKYCIYVNSQIQ